MKLGRTDRLSPEEREIVDRFERGVIDAAEAGRLLIASVRTVEVASPGAQTESEESTRGSARARRPEEAAARRLVERIAATSTKTQGLAPQAFCGFLHFSAPPTHPLAWFSRSPDGVPAYP